METMRFLVDEDLPRSLNDLIRSFGHESVDVRTTGLRGARDHLIASYAREEGRCLVTGDLDFADIRNYPPCPEKCQALREKNCLKCAPLESPDLSRCCGAAGTFFGGIQEETTVLGVPCLTLRDNTERPITVEQGTNRLVGARGENLPGALDRVLESPMPGPRRPDLWDGRAAERIMDELEKINA
jgi:predicted nuclease of predicted toxin-antitoxin system